VPGFYSQKRVGWNFHLECSVSTLFLSARARPRRVLSERSRSSLDIWSTNGPRSVPQRIQPSDHIRWLAAGSVMASFMWNASLLWFFAVSFFLKRNSNHSFLWQYWCVHVKSALDTASADRSKYTRCVCGECACVIMNLLSLSRRSTG